MGIIWTIIIGLLAGIVAKFLMPGRDPGGFIITILLGIAGAFVATFLGQAVGWYTPAKAPASSARWSARSIILVAYRMIAQPPRRLSRLPPALRVKPSLTLGG